MSEDLEEQVMELAASHRRTKILCLLLTAYSVWQLVESQGPVRESVVVGDSRLSEIGLRVGNAIITDDAVMIRDPYLQGGAIALEAFGMAPSLRLAVKHGDLTTTSLTAEVRPWDRTVHLDVSGDISSELRISTVTGAWTLRRSAFRDGKELVDELELVKPMFDQAPAPAKQARDDATGLRGGR